MSFFLSFSDTTMSLLCFFPNISFGSVSDFKKHSLFFILQVFEVMLYVWLCFFLFSEIPKFSSVISYLKLHNRQKVNNSLLPKSASKILRSLVGHVNAKKFT